MTLPVFPEFLPSSTMRSDDHFLTSTYRRYLLPTMAGILGGTVILTLDSILVGSLVGEAGLRTVNLFLPLQLFFNTLGSLVASGGAVLSGQARGKNEAGTSREIMASAFTLILALSTLFVLLGLSFSGPLTRWLAKSAWSADMESYVRVLFLAGLPKALLYLPVFYLRLDGKNGQSAGLLLSLAVLNVSLDLIFIQSFKMGVLGSALAGAVSMLVACLFGYDLLWFKKGSFAWPLNFARPVFRLDILKTGSPAALDNLAFALRILLINRLLLARSGPYLVYFAVITAVSEFSLFFINGIPQTALPILSVYSAEKSNPAIRLLMKGQFRTGLALSLAFALLLLPFHRGLASLFGVHQDMLFPLACLVASLVLAQMNTIMAGFFTATDRISLANLITLLRILVFPVVLVFLLTSTRLEGVWLFLPLSELLTLLTWLSLSRLLASRHPDWSPFLLLDDRLEKSGQVVDFTVANDPGEICLASRQITDFCEKNELTAKQTMAFSLAIEEIMTVMADKSLDGRGSFDVRAFAHEGAISLRIRCAGRQYNPIPPSRSEEERGTDSLLGIRLIRGMAKDMSYISTFGVNSFFVKIQ